MIEPEYVDMLEKENESLRKELDIAYRSLEEVWSDSRTAGLAAGTHFHIVPENDYQLKRMCKPKKWASLRAARNYIKGLYEDGKKVYIEMIKDENDKECLYHAAKFIDDDGNVNTNYLIKLYVSNHE